MSVHLGGFSSALTETYSPTEVYLYLHKSYSYGGLKTNVQKQPWYLCSLICTHGPHKVTRLRKNSFFVFVKASHPFFLTGKIRLVSNPVAFILPLSFLAGPIWSAE